MACHPTLKKNLVSISLSPSVFKDKSYPAYLFLQRKQYYDVIKNKNMTAFLTKGSWYGILKAFLGPYLRVFKSRKAIKQGESVFKVKITN